MTPNEFLKKMKAIVKRNFDNQWEQHKLSDPENAHAEADALMCEVLKELGYGEGIKIFDGMEKWYS